VRRVRARSAASRRVQFGSCSWSGFRTKTPTPELQQRDKPCARCLILPCSMSPTPLASLTTAARHEPGSPPGGRRPSLTLLTDFATGRPPPPERPSGRCRSYAKIGVQRMPLGPARKAAGAIAQLAGSLSGSRKSPTRFFDVTVGPATGCVPPTWPEPVWARRVATGSSPVF
jgi:hypothetical protein